MLIEDQALILRLLLGHFLADFVLQTNAMAEAKARGGWRSLQLYLHAGIYSLIVYMFSANWASAPWLIPTLFITHFLIDGGKAARGPKAAYFLADQAAHLLIVSALFYVLSPSAQVIIVRAIGDVWEAPRVLVVALAYAIIIWPAGKAIYSLTLPFWTQLPDTRIRGLAAAGLWIGYLERIFLLTFVLIDYPAGIALVLGLKSLFRFGEIKDPDNRMETEYILIGTLLSFAFALAVGLAAKRILASLH